MVDFCDRNCGHNNLIYFCIMNNFDITADCNLSTQ